MEGRELLVWACGWINTGQLLLLVLFCNGSLGWKCSWEEKGAVGAVGLGTVVGHSFTQLLWMAKGQQGDVWYFYKDRGSGMPQPTALI